MKHLRLLVALLALLTGVGNLSAQTWTGNEVADGDFYLFNVGSQKFLNVGDPSTGWGTHAYLTPTTGIDVTLALSDGKYTIDTKFSNGGNSHYLTANCWADGSSLAWTFTPVTIDGVNYAYSISNEESYLAANEADNYGGTTVNTVTDLSENAYWVLVSKSDLMNNMKNTASKENPVDATFIIKSANFDRNDTRNSWTQTHSGGNFTFMGKRQESWGSQTLVDAGNSMFYGIEAYGNSYEIKQVLEGLPAGTYEFTCQGFDNSGTNTSYIYAGSQEKAFTVTSPGTAALSEALENIAKGQYTGNTTGTFNIAEDNSSITVGFKRPNSGNWAVIDNARLLYYGLDLSEFEAALAESVSKANIAAEELSGNVPTAVYNKLTNAISENNKTYTTAVDYINAANAIDEEVAFAQSFVKPYSRYKNVKAAVLAISNTINTAEADSKANEALTIEEIDDAVLTVRNALTSYLPTAQLSEGETIDLTDALIDNAAPGISGTTDYWTNSGSPSLENHLFEYWNVSGATTTQTIASTLPAGNYKLTAIAYTRDNMTATLNAGTYSTNLVGCGSVNNREQGSTWIAEGNGINNLVFNLSEVTADLKIGLTADKSTGDHWICWRSFRLVYGDVFEPYTLVEGKMNAEVAAAQTTAENNYKTNPSPATYQALMDAIAAAQASAKAYEDMTTAVTKIDAALEAATSSTVSAEAYNTIKASYNEGTITDAEIMTKVAAAYDAVIPVIKSQTAAQADFTLAIQNQSFEYGDMTGWTATSSSDTGVRETSNATYSATGSDGKYLFNTWWQGVPITQAITGLPNGEYTLTVSVASDGGTIYLLANGEHNEGIETGGEYPSSDTFQETTFTFLVKDGNATIGVVGGADGTAGEHKDYVEAGYWWYKADNFRLVKNRELTEEEMAVIPTGITLDGTATIFKGKTLQLTPAFAPEDATRNVTWASDNEGVATVSAEGVVTAIAYGSANITVTSTLNAEATATCAVTVTAPLITEAENLDFAEGPVIENHITTYAKDMSANNTTYSQMQLVNGWTFGTDNGDARAAGIMAYGSSYGMGASTNTFFAPSTNPGGESTGNALGMVGVWGSTVHYLQNVKIPAGAYTITVPIYRNGGATALTKNLIGVILDNETEYLATTTTYSANQWTTETIKFNITEDTYGKLSVGLNAPNKGSAECQRLWIDGINISFEPFATADEIAALNNAIEAAEAKSLGFDQGEYAPYKNIDALKALASAKTLNVENPIAQSEVLAAINALTNATWTANEEEVNAFFDGSFASEYSHDDNVMPIGWHGIGSHDNATDVRLMWNVSSNAGLNATSSKQGAFAKFTAVYGTEVGYTMPLKAGTYSLKFIYGGWNEVGERIIKVYNDDNEATFLTETNIKAKDNKAHTTVDSWSAYNGFFTIPADGNYIFSFYRDNTTSQNQLVFSDIEIKKANVVELNDVSSEDLPNAAENAVVKLTRKFVNKWNPICLPFEVTDFSVFGDNCEVVKYTGDEMSGDDHVTLKFETVTDKMEANVPYMVWIKEDADVTSSWNLTFTGVDYNPEAPVSAGTNYDYVGVYKNYAKGTSPIATGDVILSSGTYKTVTGNGGNAIKGFRGYWKKNPSAAGAKSVSAVIDGQETDDIKSIELIKAFTEGIYNLQGQKVNHARKGVYIVNGKKVVVK